MFCPDVDRVTVDFRNGFITVVETTNNGFYKVGYKRGIVEKMFSRNQFSICQDKFNDIENSLAEGESSQKCNCKT